MDKQGRHERPGGGGLEYLDAEPVGARVPGGQHRFLVTDRVRVGGATFIDTVAPPSRATVARHRCRRLARA